MFESQIILGPWTFTTYSLALTLGILLAGALLVAPAPRPALGRRIDAALLALVLGLIGARLLHVVLHWDYFFNRLDETLRIEAGGLDGRGAILGAVLGLAWGARWSGLALRPLLDRAALALPLLALVGWWACGAAACAYGYEVATRADYPAWLTWEARDIYGLIAPRFAVQPLGMGLAGALLGLLLLLTGMGWLRGRRFWLALLLYALGSFALGFLRADDVLFFAGLRAEQALDLWLAGLALVGLLRRTNQ